MSLVFEKKFDGPGLHAFIIGISDYKHLPLKGEPIPPIGDTYGMFKLSSPALSALNVLKFLEKPPKGVKLFRPLKSCHLLVAPSEIERGNPDRFDNHNTVDHLPNWDNFFKDGINWRSQAEKDEEGQTFFYFSGHGVAFTSTDAALILQNFNSDPNLPPFNDAVSVDNIRNFMFGSNAKPKIAKTQHYFIDACRVSPDPNNNPRKQLTIEPPGRKFATIDLKKRERDLRNKTTVFATVTGDEAEAKPGECTLFSERLLQALAYGADKRRISGRTGWFVDGQALNRVFQEPVEDQFIDPVTERNGDPITELDNAPKATIKITIDPPDACELGRVSLSGHEKEFNWPTPINPHPHRFSAPAGDYEFRVDFSPEDGFACHKEIPRIEWPSVDLTAKILEI